MNRRYHELDSLRGIAAMTIFLFHITMFLPDTWREGAIWDSIFLSPLHIFIIGEQPVILFFVLSGFVLSLPFFSGKNTSYLPFIMKRVIRLYVPYVVSIIFTMILFSWFSSRGIEGMGTLFNMLWVDPINAQLIGDHLLFLGNYNVYSFNIVIWTLIHEMRISLIIPLLIMLVIRYSWKVNLAFGIMLAMLGAGFHLVLQEPYQPLYKTLFYVVMFIVGIILSKHRLYLIEWFQSLTQKNKVFLTIIAIVLYSYADLFSNPMLVDWITTMGVSILLVISLASQRSAKILLWKPLQFLGKVSYSLYLYHLPLLLSLIYIFYGKLSLPIIAGLSIILTLLVSNIAWRLVEHPSIKLGNKLSEKFTVKTVPTVMNEEEEMIK